MQTQTPITCPEEEELAALAEGTLGDRRADALKEHVRSCGRCRGFLDEAEANDAFVPEVRRAASHEKAAAADNCAADPSPFDPHLLPGFAIRREIHRGGQGVVYEATQHSTGQTVAIKIMRDGPFAGPEDRARFDREVRILGHLNHPNIVGIHDRGEIAGCYYLVMDFIDGDPFDAYTASNDLTIRQKLEMFATVCDAVHSAHLRAVIHRDLKPSNILIDRNGGPYILDFGLAKRVGDDVTQATVTRSGHFMGSLPWASPEQVEGVSESIDLRTDVYSLGAVLYRVLAGQSPFDVSGSALATSRRVLYDEPLPPSAHARELRGDIDAIVAGCLGKRPEERYESAGALASDIRRHLAGEPVTVRAHSASYRLRKAFRRHRLAVWTSAAAFAFVVGVAATILSAYTNARRREQVEAARYVQLVSQAQAGIEKNNIGHARKMLSECPNGQRAWEWGFLSSRTDQSAGILERPDGQLTDLVISRNDRWIAAGSQAGNVYVWTLPDKALRPVISAHVGAVNGLAFTADERFLIIAGDDGKLRRWRIAPGQFEHELLQTNASAATVAADAVGRRIAAGAQDNRLYLFDAGTGALLWNRPAHSLGVSAVEFSPDGAYIASGGYDGTVQIWNADTGDPVYACDEFRGVITGLSFDRTGSRLLISDALGNASVTDWRSTRATCVQALDTEKTTAAALFPDGEHYLVGCANGLIRVFEAKGCTLAAELRGHEYGVVSFAFSAKGTWFASAAYDGTVRFWQIRPDANPIRLRGHYSTVQALCFADEGRALITGGSDLLLRRWDIETGALLQTIPGHRDSITDCFSTPDGGTLLTAAYLDGIRLWKAESGEFIRSLDITRGTAALNTVSICPDGTCVASSFQDGIVGVWDLETGKPTWNRRATAELMGTLAVSPDGRYLAAGDSEGCANIWSISDGRLIHRTSPIDEHIWAVAFTNDGAHLAVGGSTIVGLIDAQTFREVWVMPGHTSPVASLAISPDDRRLVSGSQDGTIKLWRVVDGVQVLLLHEEPGTVMKVAFSPDGERIAAAFMDGAVRVWDSRNRDSEVRAERAVVAETAERLEDVFTRGHSSSSVAEMLRADTTLDADARKAALELLTIRGDNPWQLSEEAWYVVRKPGGSQEDYRMALDKAELANRLLPDHPSLLNNLGVARYRCGQFAKALDALARSDQLRAGTEVQDIAFQAMALCGLGRLEEARAMLTRAQSLANSTDSGRDGWRQGHLREAEGIIQSANGSMSGR